MNLSINEKLRQENIAFLQKEGFPYNKNLPLLDIEECCKTEKEIADRINILHIFYAIYLEGKKSKKFFYNLIKDEGWASHLSKSEKSLLNGLFLKEKDVIQFSWLKENIFILLWSANNNIQNINKTDEIDIAEIYQEIPPEMGYSNFIKSLELRPLHEILKELDLYYNLHWIAKHSEELNLNKELNLSVIIERRKALEWVLDKTVDWDDIVLDT